MHRHCDQLAALVESHAGAPARYQSDWVQIMKGAVVLKAMASSRQLSASFIAVGFNIGIDVREGWLRRDWRARPCLRHCQGWRAKLLQLKPNILHFGGLARLARTFSSNCWYWLFGQRNAISGVWREIGNPQNSGPGPLAQALLHRHKVQSGYLLGTDRCIGV